MSSPASLSAIITCYNSGFLVLDAIGSLTGQLTEGALEIIVVDDGSTDQASLAALARAEALAGVSVIRAPANEGVQQARNRGLAAARNDFVMVLDSDDGLAAPDPASGERSYLDQATAMLRNDDGLAFVHTMSRMFGAFDGLTISAYPVTEQLVLRKHHVPTSIVFRRDNRATYDPAVLKWQDWSFAIGLMAARWRRGQTNRIGFVRGAFHRYRVHHVWDRISSRGADEYAMTLRTVEANLDYFRAHHGAGDASALARLVLGNKPDRLTDLLHMAAFDLQQALQVATERDFEMTSPYSNLGIP